MASRIAVETDDLPSVEQQRHGVAVAVVQATALSHALAQRLDLEQLKGAGDLAHSLARTLIMREQAREASGQDAGYRLGRAEAALDLMTADLAAAREELLLLRTEKAQTSWVVALAPIGSQIVDLVAALKKGGAEEPYRLVDRLLALGGGHDLVRGYAAAMVADLEGRNGPS